MKDNYNCAILASSVYFTWWWPWKIAPKHVVDNILNRCHIHWLVCVDGGFTVLFNCTHTGINRVKIKTVKISTDCFPDTALVVFLSPSTQIHDHYLKLGHDHPFTRFPLHYSSITPSRKAKFTNVVKNTVYTAITATYIIRFWINTGRKYNSRRYNRNLQPRFRSR